MVTPTDVANRALQYVGASRIAVGALLTEDSKNASEIRACYDILRRAELRRNIWRFAIRTVALRPIAVATSKLVAFGTWSSVTAYALNDIVTGPDGIVYQSRVTANTANTPASNPTKWSLYFGSIVSQEFVAGTAYYAGELVTSSGILYISKISANMDTPPTANWMTMATVPTLSAPNFVYPLGVGADSVTSSAYRLPNGFLREAPQNPKNGAVSIMGDPIGNAYSDWSYESDYLISPSGGVILYRYVADLADTEAFDALFIEGFACRLAIAVCEPLTQSTTKAQAVASEYNKFMSEARTVNGIETGSVEPPLDNYLECRI